MRVLVAVVVLMLLAQSAFAVTNQFAATFDIKPCVVLNAQVKLANEFALFEGRREMEKPGALWAEIRCPDGYDKMDELKNKLLWSLQAALAYNYDYNMPDHCRDLGGFSSANKGGKHTVNVMFACPPGLPSGPDRHE